MMSFIYTILSPLCNVGSDTNAASQKLDGVDVMDERLYHEVYISSFIHSSFSLLSNDTIIDK